MASVTVYSSDKVDDLIANTVTGASISDGHLIIQFKDGSTLDVGAVLSGLVDASLTEKGIVELATDVETATGTDSTRAVTPLALAPLIQTRLSKDGVKTTVAVGDPQEMTMTIGGVLRAWWNEWRALRGRNPYSTYADALVRAVVMDGDFTNGHAFEIEDRRTTNSITTIWGVHWGNGQMTIQDQLVGTVFTLDAGDTEDDIPPELPQGTLIMRRL